MTTPVIIWSKKDRDERGAYHHSFDLNGTNYACYLSPTGDDYSCVVTRANEIDGGVETWKPSLKAAKRFLEDFARNEVAAVKTVETIGVNNANEGKVIAFCNPGRDTFVSQAIVEQATIKGHAWEVIAVDDAHSLAEVMKGLKTIQREGMTEVKANAKPRVESAYVKTLRAELLALRLKHGYTMPRSGEESYGHEWHPTKLVKHSAVVRIAKLIRLIQLTKRGYSESMNETVFYSGGRIHRRAWAKRQRKAWNRKNDR